MDSEAATSSHIEEMIQELAQQEDVEAPATEMPQERPSLNPQLGKKILRL